MKKTVFFTITLVWTIFSCGNEKTENYSLPPYLNKVRKVAYDDRVNFYFNNDIICSQWNLGTDTNKYFLIHKFFPLGRKREMIFNEEIYFLENGEIIADSSLYYSCQEQGDNLLITYCSYSKNDFCKIAINNYYDEDFVPTRIGDTMIVKGNSFLLVNYKKYCTNDTLRMVLMPKIAENPDPETRYTYAMLLVEFPNRYNFSNVE
jgi:hypothetical protein